MTHSLFSVFAVRFCRACWLKGLAGWLLVMYEISNKTKLKLELHGNYSKDFHLIVIHSYSFGSVFMFAGRFHIIDFFARPRQISAHVFIRILFFFCFMEMSAVFIILIFGRLGSTRQLLLFSLVYCRLQACSLLTIHTRNGNIIKQQRKSR